MNVSVNLSMFTIAKTFADQQTEQLSRLITIEPTKTQIMELHTKLMEDIKSTLNEALDEFRKQTEAREREDPVEVIKNAMERYTAAVERQASTIERQMESMETLSNAMNRMADVLDRRVIGG